MRERKTGNQSQICKRSHSPLFFIGNRHCSDAAGAICESKNVFGSAKRQQITLYREPGLLPNLPGLHAETSCQGFCLSPRTTAARRRRTPRELLAPKPSHGGRSVPRACDARRLLGALERAGANSAGFGDGGTQICCSEPPTVCSRPAQRGALRGSQNSNCEAILPWRLPRQRLESHAIQGAISG